MVTSDKIAGPIDSPKEKKNGLVKDELEMTKIKKMEEIDDELLKKAIDPIKPEKKVKPKITTSDKSYCEIDWNKVQVIEDIKIILQKFNFTFDINTIKSDDLINRYLKN